MSPCPQQKVSAYLRRFCGSSACPSAPERHQGADQLVLGPPLPGGPALWLPFGRGGSLHASARQLFSLWSAAAPRSLRARCTSQTEVGVKVGWEGVGGHLESLSRVPAHVDTSFNRTDQIPMNTKKLTSGPVVRLNELKLFFR